MKGEKSYKDPHGKTLVRLAGCKGCLLRCQFNGAVAVEAGSKKLFACNTVIQIKKLLGLSNF